MVAILRGHVVGREESFRGRSFRNVVDTGNIDGLNAGCGVSGRDATTSTSSDFGNNIFDTSDFVGRH